MDNNIDITKQGQPDLSRGETRRKRILLSVLIIISVLVNYNLFKSQHTDPNELSQEYWLKTFVEFYLENMNRLSEFLLRKTIFFAIFSRVFLADCSQMFSSVRSAINNGPEHSIEYKCPIVLKVIFHIFNLLVQVLVSCWQECKCKIEEYKLKIEENKFKKED
ncbi:ABC transporter [Candida maltosa Xu316]|uniref:ABC transporter n=1 Tax=Candida maltosa (strain Xu316) TaxID=1245528 RepID=M3JSC4_CANMX|nr:ABC transporter [Candida maltosa Xu316]